MKTLFTALFFWICFIAGAQEIDSTKMYVKNVTFQARDIEAFAIRLITGGELYEDFYELAKAKFRVANPPSNLQGVTIDSIRVDVLIDLVRWMRSSDYGTVANYFARVDAVIKALPNAYLQRVMNDIDAGYIQNIVQTRTEGRRRLRGIRL